MTLGPALRALANSAWVVALVLALVIAEAPPWRGLVALVFGTVLVLLPRLDDRIVVVFVATAVVPSLLPALGASAGIAVIAALGVAAVASVAVRRSGWRVAVACGVAAVGLVLLGKQEAAALVVPAAASVVFGLGLAVLGLVGVVLAAPASSRLAGWTVAGMGAMTVASGAQLARDVDTLSVEQAAARVAEAGAGRLWPEVERRAVAALDRDEPGAVDAALEVVRLAPTRERLGAVLVRRGVADDVVMSGWDPAAALDADVAIATARALDRHGELGRAVTLLRRLPRRGDAMFWLALFAAEADDSALAAAAWTHAEVPDGVTVGSAADLACTDWVTVHTVAIHRPLEAVRVDVVPWSGEPTQLRVRLGGEALGELALAPDGAVWELPVARPPGAYRLRLEVVGDFAAAGAVHVELVTSG